MVYAAGTSSPAATEFFRTIGLTEFHFGLLSGLPLVMLFVQFVGALLASRLPSRKMPFVVLSCFSRILYIPVALIPIVLPGLPAGAVVWSTIALLALSQALGNFIVPLWFSWMGDVIPGAVMNRFWSRRMLWMQLAWTAAYLVVAAFTYLAGVRIEVVYAVTVIGGVVAGLADVLLFIRVHEPPAAPTRAERLDVILLEPLRHADYRTFVLFMCAWQMGVSFFGPFSQLYLLKSMGLTPWQVTIIWCMYGIASVLTANLWGVLSSRYGNRPVLSVCVWAKSLVVIAFVFCTPATAMRLLLAACLFDGILNTGFAIASNGYMFKIAPRENRSMYVAAITGFAGICGGVMAMVAGSLLESLSGFTAHVLGQVWTHFHVVFLVSILFRWMGIVLVHRIREPRSGSSLQVVGYLLDELPAQFMQIPIAWFRRLAGPDRDHRAE